MDTIPLVMKTEISLGKTSIVLRFFSSYYQMYMLHCGMYWMYSNMSEIKVILVLSFLMHIHRCYVYMYTMLLFLHFSKDVVMSQYMFKCSREITPASLMQLQHFIFTCLLQCKSAFFLLFPVYEINGNILYF